MKKNWLAYLLTVTLLVLGVAAANQNSAASLYCSDLAKCSGEAGCPSGGNVDWCYINCTNGGTVLCNVRGDDEMN